jgi:hypothetical protein
VVYDLTQDPPEVVSTTWTNATTGLELADPPSGADLAFLGGGINPSQLPATLGRKAAAGSLGVVLSTEDKASLDAVAGADQLPALLGPQAAADSLGVALSTEDAANLQAVADQTGGFSASHLAATATTLVKTGAGLLHGVTVNAKGTGTSTVKVYDGLTAGGTLLASIDTTNLAGLFLYDIAFAVGLCVVIAGSTAPDVTVSYR